MYWPSLLMVWAYPLSVGWPMQMHCKNVLAHPLAQTFSYSQPIHLLQVGQYNCIIKMFLAHPSAQTFLWSGPICFLWVSPCDCIVKMFLTFFGPLPYLDISPSSPYMFWLTCYLWFIVQYQLRSTGPLLLCICTSQLLQCQQYI
jgi:hypothetical protein